MRIGSSIFLIALGAILAWAISPGLIPNVDQPMLGYIRLPVGVIGVLPSLILASPGRSRTRPCAKSAPGRPGPDRSWLSWSSRR